MPDSLADRLMTGRTALSQGPGLNGWQLILNLQADAAVCPETIFLTDTMSLHPLLNPAVTGASVENLLNA
jgi:hypothetical protein